MSWTQPICDPCWPTWSLAKHGRVIEPVRLLDPEIERCCHCGESTESGIYIRVNPAEVMYPS